MLKVWYSICVICAGENDINGFYLAVFSVDVASACHFVAQHLPPTLQPYRSACDIGYAIVILAMLVKTI